MGLGTRENRGLAHDEALRVDEVQRERQANREAERVAVEQSRQEVLSLLTAEAMEALTETEADFGSELPLWALQDFLRQGCLSRESAMNLFE
jgi:hypothetical protein